FVADGADLGENLRVGQFGDSFDELRAVYRIRNLGDDDLLATFRVFFDRGSTANLGAATSGGGVVADAPVAENGAPGGEVGALHVFERIRDRDLRVVDRGADAVDDFAEVVRRNIRRHADGDTGAAVDEQVGE